MGITPKSFEQIMSDSIKELTKSLEIDLYDVYGRPSHERGLRKVLGNLGVKSANSKTLLGGAPLTIESLSSVLNQATFNTGDLKLWTDVMKIDN